MTKDTWIDYATRRLEEGRGYIKRSYADVSQAKGVADLVGRLAERLRAGAGYFKGKTVAILGPAGGGKTTLIHYLRSSAATTHQTTSGLETVDRRFEVDRGQWVKISNDVGGDVAYRGLWAELMKALNPHAVIFVLDGRKPTESVLADMTRCLEDALTARSTQPRRLALIYVMVNFFDVWNQDPAKRDVLRSRVQLVVDEHKSRFGLSGLRVEARATHMNPHMTCWPELDNTLEHFGRDLNQI